MSLSRLRLRLTAGFALAFAIGLTVLSGLSLGYLWREASARLRANLEQVAHGVVRALERELRETPDSTLGFAASEVVAEWPLNDDSFVIVDERGTAVGQADRARAAPSILAAFAASRTNVQFAAASGDQDFRVLAIRSVSVSDGVKRRVFSVLAYHTTEGMEGDVQLVATALVLIAPLIVALSLLLGYALAKRALTPMEDLRTAIGAIAPGDLTARLPVTEPRDEIGALASAFNAMFERLEHAQRRNHRFVREAAHQIRTPLTLVLGESSNQLSHADTLNETRSALTRIHTAAEQMRHRVDGLFLLAEAQAGVTIRLEESVELDGIVLEGTDLMRARASQLGKTLAIGTADPLVVRGNAALLREAVLELIENGCRHGDAGVPITVSVIASDNRARLTVESAGSPFVLTQAGEARDPSSPGGLGLPIVEWIARGHHGDLTLTSNHGRNTLAMSLPTAARAIE